MWDRCGRPRHLNPESMAGVAITLVPMPSEPRRIVSLLPAATEIVAALGLADRLVGRSHECDEPAAVLGLPPLTAPRIDPSQPSGSIHEQVSRSTGPLFALDIERLAALKPDLILTQAACAVCAISEDEVATAVRTGGVETQVIALSPASLGDLFRDILTVGEATGRLAEARTVVAELQARCDAVNHTVEAGPTSAIIEWLDPPMAAGNWVPEMVRLAGGRDVLGKEGAHSHWITWADEIGRAHV